MVYHILNGDTLAEKFPGQETGGVTIIIREASIDGPVTTKYDSSYWDLRKTYIQKTYQETREGYENRVMPELKRLENITANDEVYLWFEDDLFCQCNMWFVVDYITRHIQPTFYRVFPEADLQYWKGFGDATPAELIAYFKQAVVLEEEDILHIRQLWNAYVKVDNPALISLSEEPCSGIRFQSDVIRAQIDRNQDQPGTGRPYKTLSALLHKNSNLTFYQLFEKFVQQDGIYGFGDTQVRNMLRELNEQVI